MYANTKDAGRTFSAFVRTLTGNRPQLAIRSVIASPSARRLFSPEELAEVYSDYQIDGPGLIDSESGARVGIYEIERGRILFVVESGADGLVEIVCLEDFGLSKHSRWSIPYGHYERQRIERSEYPPPERGCPGSAVALVVVAAVASVVTTLVFLAYLVL